MPSISKFHQNLKNIDTKEAQNEAISLYLCEKHDRCKPGAFHPLKLDAAHRSIERQRLRHLIARYKAAESLNPSHSMLPYLRKHSNNSHRASVGQILCDHFNLCLLPTTPFLAFNCEPVPFGSTPTNRISRGWLLTPNATLSWLPNPQNLIWSEVFKLLESHHQDAPWLPKTPTDPGFFALQDRYPRAKGLCYLHAFIQTGSPSEPAIRKVTLGLDRNAGRLYLLAFLLSKVSDGFCVAPNTPELPGLYPCSQLTLGNFP